MHIIFPSTFPLFEILHSFVSFFFGKSLDLPSAAASFSFSFLTACFRALAPTALEKATQHNTFNQTHDLTYLFEALGRETFPH